MLMIAVAAVVTGFGSAAATARVVDDRHAMACQQALSAELAGLGEGVSVYASDPPPCRRYSRVQQQAWLVQLTGGRP
jgi:hypothetical protein